MNKQFIYLVIGAISILSTSAHARHFYTAQTKITAYYSSFEVNQHMLGEVMVLLRTASDGKFPHLVINGKRCDIKKAVFSSRVHIEETSYDLVLNSECVFEAILASIAMQDSYGEKAHQLLLRYVSNPKILHTEFDTYNTDSLTNKFQYHDNASEESIHMVINLPKLITIR